MSTMDPPTLPDDPLLAPGPSSPPKGTFKKLFQSVRIASRSLRTSPGFKVKVVDVAKTLTRLAADAAGEAGVPGLAVGIGILDEVLGKIQTMSGNVEGVNSLEERIAKLKANMAVFESLPPDQALQENVQHSIEDLKKTWAIIGQGAQKIADRGRFKRFVTSGVDANELGKLVGQIKASIDDFMLHEVLVVGRDVNQMHQTVKAMAAIVEDSFMPTYAKRAQYNASSVRRPCLPNTRVVILGQVQDWIGPPGMDNAVPNAQDGIVYWINGLAGTGKTTIAYSIASWCKEQGILGASFFCSRQDAECRDPNLIFVTICRELCQFHAPFKAEVAKVLQMDPSVAHSSPAEQFERLILKPLEVLKDALPKTVIVIDALDECEDAQATSTVLNVLAKFVPRITETLHRSLVVVITSRPERRVTALFNKSRKTSLDGTATRLLLHMLELDAVKDDIKLCIQHEFEEAIGVFEVEEGWPSERNMDELAELSGGLFIVATTAVRFIMDTKEAGVPQARMHALFQSRSASQTPSTVLDVLYTSIAEAASPRTPERFTSSARPLQHILGTIALAREPVSSATLGAILGMSTTDARNMLVGLHSVLHIPDDHNKVIRIIHPTFPEFLLATHLEKPGDFCIDASEQHAFFFHRNIQIMKALKRNIAAFPSHLLWKKEVPTLGTDVERCIPPHLSYATRHWTAHLDGATGSSNLADACSAFNEFVHHRLLYWLEASSLLGALDTAVVGLTVTCAACRKMGGVFAELISLLADSRRLALAYFYCINVAPLELYRSVLAFAPDQSLVKKVYREELWGAPIARSDAVLNWEPCIDGLLTIVNEGATWMDFSPDRSRYIGNNRSSICNAMTYKGLVTLDPQTNRVSCAVFCPDGQHVAMVSSKREKTLDIWHLTSGERVHSFEGHRNDIHFITYSADSRYILSADRHEIRLWSVSDRQSSLTLPWDLDRPWGIALSRDGAVIALPNLADDGLCLYSTATQTSGQLPLSAKMRTAAFSLDGRYVAASTNATISIWTLADRSLTRSLDAPSNPNRLAFSNDSTRLGYGLEDGSVWVWQIESSDPPVILRGHTESVENVLWSLDDSQIISLSRDLSMRIWDATRNPVADGQPQLPMDSISLPESPHPTVLCKVKDDFDIFHLPGPAPVEPLPHDAPTMTLHANTADAWDAALSMESSRLPAARMLSHAHDWELLTGQRHISSLYPLVTFSRDAALIAFVSRSNSSNRAAQVCNLHTGAVVTTLSFGQPALSLALSPDLTLLSAGFFSGEVQVWKIAAQKRVASHKPHTSWVHAVAFSSNGQLLASGDQDGLVCIHHVMKKRTLHTLAFSDRSQWVLRIAFSADDKHIIALGDSHYALIGETATGAVIHEVLLSTDAWTRTLDFAPDYTGLLVHTEDGQVHKINMDQTEPRIWPFYSISDGGWVMARSPGVPPRRLCWLPSEWRTPFSLGGPFLWMMDEKRKCSVVIDVSEVEGLELNLSPMSGTDFTSIADTDSTSVAETDSTS